MTDRNDIARVLTDKDMEDLGAPYLSMAEAPPQASYYMPPPLPSPPPSNASPDPQYSGGRVGVGPLSLGGFAAAAGPLNRKQLNPYGGMQLRYGRSF